MGGGGVETVDTIPEWAKPVFQKALGHAEDLFDEGAFGAIDPRQDMANEMMTRFAFQSDQKADLLGNTMEDMYNISQGAARPDVEAMKDAAILRAKQEMVPTTQMHSGMGTMTSNVGGGRQQIDIQDSANRVAAEMADLDFQAEAEAFRREEAARAGLGAMFKDYAGAKTFGPDILTEVGKEIAGRPREEFMQFRDAIDYTQPTQQAASGGK